MEGTYIDFLRRSSETRDTENKINVIHMPKAYVKGFRHGNTFYVPLIGRRTLISSMQDNKTDEAYYPLNIVDSLYLREYKGVVTFLKNAFIRSTLTKIKLKEEIYLTGCGCIFKGDMTPLMLAYANMDASFDGVPNSLTVYINKCVFTEEAILLKHIRTNAIKTLAIETVNVYCWARSTTYHISPVINITKDFSDILFTPKVPDINFNEENVNKLLADSVDDIMRMI